MFVEDGIRRAAVLRVGGLGAVFMDTGYGRVSVWGRGEWQGGVGQTGKRANWQGAVGWCHSDEWSEEESNVV